MAIKKDAHRLFGLLGKNIDYSFSRGYFTKKFEQEKLLYHEYKNFDIDRIEKIDQILSKENLAGLLLLSN